MELNLAMRSARRRGRSCRLDGNFAALRETRCSYFLNLILPGLSTDEIEVEMDKESGLILRGQSYSKEVGMLKWRCRLMSKRRRPFKIPENVNMGATRGSFQQQILHVVMPKLMRQSRMSKSTVIHIHSSPHQQKSQAASSPAPPVKVDHSLCCSDKSEIVNKDTISSSTISVMSIGQGKIQQYRRRRRRSINKITANSE